MSLAGSLPSSPATIRRSGIRGPPLTSLSAPSSPANGRKARQRTAAIAAAAATANVDGVPTSSLSSFADVVVEAASHSLFVRSQSQEGVHSDVMTAAAAAAAWSTRTWGNRTQPLFSKGLMEALKEKGAATSFVDIAGGTPEPEAPAEPECSLEEEMKSLRSRLKQARDEIRASTVEAIGCRNDLKEVRHKGHRRLTRKSSLEEFQKNGRWNNRPAAVSNIKYRRSSSSSSNGSLDDSDSSNDSSDYDDASEEEGPNDDAQSWASSSTTSVAGRRRRRHNAEAGKAGRRQLGSYEQSQYTTGAAEDAAGENIFDGSNVTAAAAAASTAAALADDRRSRLGQMLTSLHAGGETSSRSTPVSKMAGHGGMPSSPKSRRRKKKGGRAAVAGAGSGGNGSPKGSPKVRRKKKGANGSPRKRGSKAAKSSSSRDVVDINSGVKPSISMPSSALSRSYPKLLPATLKSNSTPSSPRVSRRGVAEMPSPAQVAAAIEAKREVQSYSLSQPSAEHAVRKSNMNLMMQSPITSRNSSLVSLLSLAPKLSALMHQSSPSKQATSG